MSWPISIRDTKYLENILKEDKEIDLPRECKWNSGVIYNLLQYADRVLPRFKLLSDKQARKVADSVAYLMRPDLIKQAGHSLFGVQPLPEFIFLKIYGEDGVKVHLRNNPNELSEEWNFHAGEYMNVGQELFRCYAATISWIPKMYEILDPESHSFQPAFRLSDMTTFLLVPNDLTDYEYSQEEIDNFNRSLIKRASEI